MIDNMEYVIFTLDGEYYGIDIHNVENIEKKVSITRVPHTKNYIMGIINLRGNIIPVIDLRTRFGLENKDFDDDVRIIIVNYEDLQIGIIVDSSSETLQLTEKDIDKAPSIKSGTNEEFVKDVGKHDDRIIMLLDLKKVLGISVQEE